MATFVPQGPEASPLLTLLKAAREASVNSLPKQAQEQLARHWELVKAWNERTNLTALSDDTEAFYLHYLDCLAGAALLEGGPVVDFGSGAGYPGLVLAVARPDLTFELVEPRRKRVSFLRVAVSTLALRNVRVREGRLEDPPRKIFRHAVTRATFRDPATLRQAFAWLEPRGSLMVWRSGAPVTPTPAIDAFIRTSLPYTLREMTRHIERWTLPPESA